MIRLRVLGSTELIGFGGDEVQAVLAQPKRLALLVYLAASRGFHRRDTLHAMFWPEQDYQRARGSLNQAIGFLRKALGSSDSVILSRGASELGVDHGSLWCDAVSFWAEVEAKRHGEALDLYRGDLLPGFHVGQSSAFDDWLEGERTRLRKAAARAAREAAAARERTGQLTTAVANARRAVDLCGADERAVRGLLSLLDRLGDRAGAISAYEAFVRRLASELDVEPSAETVEVFDEIRTRPVGSAIHHADSPRGASSPGNATIGAQSGWRMVREIGRGGMATVYMAVDLKHDRHVAVKELRPELATQVAGELFLREIQIMARLAHPHILPLIDSGTREGLPYLVTPYVAGESLRARLGREGPLTLEEALRLTMEIAQALDYAHRHGVIHCDIKPENILLADGHAIVADFGIARAIIASGAGDSADSPAGLAIGSSRYMSPESLQGRSVGVQTDIYALGCVLIEMLDGAVPEEAKLAPSSLHRFNPEIAKLTADCVATDPARRVRSAAVLIRRLEAVARVTHPAEEAKANRPPAQADWSRQRDVGFWAGVIFVCAFAIVGILGLTRMPAPNVIDLAVEPTVAGWRRVGTGNDFQVGEDRIVAHGGASSGHVTSRSAEPAGFGGLGQFIRANDYRGRRVRLSAYVKTRAVARGHVGLWLRVDGGGGILAFDNSEYTRSIIGTTDWSLVSVALDVGRNATGLAFGLALASVGEAWIDDATLEVVGADVPARETLFPPRPDPANRERQLRLYEAMPTAPVNMAFESEARPREGFVPAVDGARLFYSVAGNGPDTVLVFETTVLGGDFASLLAQRTLVFFDPRGRGKSETAIDPTDSRVASDVADIEAVRRAFGMSRMHLVGWSSGGVVTAAYAGQYPLRVKSLVQIDPAPMSDAHDFRAKIVGVRAPVLIVWSDGNVDPPDAARAWAGAFREARVFTVHGGGHLPWVDRPDVFFSALDQFLRGVWPSEGR